MSWPSLPDLKLLPFAGIYSPEVNRLPCSGFPFSSCCHCHLHDVYQGKVHLLNSSEKHKMYSLHNQSIFFLLGLCSRCSLHLWSIYPFLWIKMFLDSQDNIPISCKTCLRWISPLFLLCPESLQLHSDLISHLGNSKNHEAILTKAVCEYIVHINNLQSGPLRVVTLVSRAVVTICAESEVS